MTKRTINLLLSIPLGLFMNWLFLLLSPLIFYYGPLRPRDPHQDSYYKQEWQILIYGLMLIVNICIFYYYIKRFSDNSKKWSQTLGYFILTLLLWNVILYYITYLVLK